MKMIAVCQQCWKSSEVAKEASAMWGRMRAIALPSRSTNGNTAPHIRRTDWRSVRQQEEWGNESNAHPWNSHFYIEVEEWLSSVRLCRKTRYCVGVVHQVLLHPVFICVSLLHVVDMPMSSFVVKDASIAGWWWGFERLNVCTILRRLHIPHWRPYIRQVLTHATYYHKRFNPYGRVDWWTDLRTPSIW